MDSNEVIAAARGLKISNFLGAFAADQICGIRSNQVGTLIVNTNYPLSGNFVHIQNVLWKGS